MGRGFRGVKDDLSEIGRHLLDIACFLAPLMATTYPDSPPSSPHSPRSPRNSTPRVIAGALNDFAEIGGGLRGGISRLSNVVKKSSGSRNRGGDSTPRAGGSVRVSEEVLDFVRGLVKCPESWLEFPVPVDDNFDMSCHQKDHIITIERLVPSLGALRISLCPNFMNEESFWKIYFVLLHPRLTEHESDFLSTHQIVEEMRTSMKKKMQTRVNSESQNLIAESSSTSRLDTESQNPVSESSSTSRLDTESQNPVAETSSSAMSNKGSVVRQDDDQADTPSTTTKTTSLQYIVRWFDTPAAPEKMDASTDSRKKLRRKKDECYSETEDDDGIVLLKKYGRAGQESSSSSDERKAFFGGRDKALPHRMHDKESADESSSDWQAVEDSDFEVVEGS